MANNFSCKVKVKYNYKKFGEITKKLSSTISTGIEDVLKNIQVYAIRLEKGHHEDGILVEMVDTSTMEIKGRVYTNKETLPFAMFEHFGTGQYAEMNHVGKTKHFIESGYTEWFIPVNKVERSLPYPIITINENQFYIAHGVTPNHFMTDAEFQTRENNVNAIKEQINNMLKEVCK